MYALSRLPDLMHDPAIQCTGHTMRAIISGLAAFIAGSIGWWLGEHASFAAAVLLSAITGPVGFYYGRRWFDENLG